MDVDWLVVWLSVRLKCAVVIAFPINGVKPFDNGIGISALVYVVEGSKIGVDLIQENFAHFA